MAENEIPTLTIKRPHVPYGPEEVPTWQADADYLDHAARNISGGYSVGGYNVTTTVINLLHDVAAQLRQAGQAISIEERTAAERFADYAAAQFDSTLDYDGAEVKRRILITAHLMAPDHTERAADCAICNDDDRLDFTEDA